MCWTLDHAIVEGMGRADANLIKPEKTDRVATVVSASSHVPPRAQELLETICGLCRLPALWSLPGYENIPGSVLTKTSLSHLPVYNDLQLVPGEQAAWWGDPLSKKMVEMQKRRSLLAPSQFTMWGRGSRRFGCRCAGSLTENSAVGY